MRKSLAILVVILISSFVIPSIPAQAVQMDVLQTCPYGAEYAPGDKIAELATETSDVTWLGGNRYALDSAAGPINYKDSYDDPSELWKPIDTTIVNGQITRAPYTAVFDYDNKVVTVTDKRTGAVTTIQLDSLGGNSMAGVGTDVENGNTVTWANVATDTDVKVVANNNQIRFERILKSANAPTDATFDITQTGDSIKLTSQAQDKTRTIPLIASVSDPVVSMGKRTIQSVSMADLNLEDTQINGTLNEDIDTDNAGEIVYPLVIDPTLNISVAASTDDCYFFTGNIYLNAAYMLLGNGGFSVDSALRFLNVAVPIGATPTAADIIFKSYAAQSGDTCKVKIYGENPTNANPATYSTYANVVGRTLTSDFVSWTIGHWTGAQSDAGTTTSDLTQLIKDIIANANWVSGNAMAFQLNDDGSDGGAGRQADAYDYGSGYAVLHIEYTTFVPPSVTTSAASPVSVTTATLQGAITTTGGANADQEGFAYGTVSQSLLSTNVTPPNGYTTNWTQFGSYGIASFSYGVIGLVSGQTYYYRAYAHNTYGWNYGNEVVFSTIGTPTITNLPPAYVSVYTAQLNSVVVSDGGQPCDVRFGFGTSSHAASFSSYTNLTTWVNDTYSTGSNPDVNLVGLTLGTKYYYNVQIENDSGLSTGVESTFTTATGLNPPTNFIAIPSYNSITFTWSNAAGSSLTLVRVSPSTYPNTTADGTLLYLGTLSSCTYSGLTAGQTVYASAWGSSGGFYSAAKATTLGTTTAGASVSYPAPPTLTTNPWTAMPSELGLANFPLYSVGNQLFDTYSMPRATGWVLLYILIVFIIGALIYTKAPTPNLLLVTFTMSILLAFGSILSPPLIPPWLDFFFILTVIVIGWVLNRLS